MTLVELLVVVAVITLLSAITLPTMRTVMTQRKSSQASILVRNMLEAARARAIARGRSVAVVLERVSSRADRNPSYDSTQPISETNFPLASSVASNTDFAGNYDLYNSCIRMSFAETPAPIVFDNVTFTLIGNQLTLSGVSTDSRFAECVRPGCLIEFPFVPAATRQLLVISVTLSGTNYIVEVDNPPTALTAVPGYFDSLILGRQPIRTSIPNIPQPSALPPTSRMIVHMLPQPVATQITDLPKGTCVDLSLSGFGSDTRWVSSVVSVQNIINLRDARRHLASDWIFPTTDPAPVSLRPVYVVFGPSGVLESVIMNTFSGATGSPLVAKYEVHDDLYLFVGKTDQIIRVDGVASASGIAATQGGTTASDIYPTDLEAQNIKANINDSSAQWVRISPNSGSIAVSSVASAYESQLPDGTMPMATSFKTIGEVLARSRTLSFTDEATAQ